MISMVPKTARPTRQVRPDDLAAPIADGADAVERALDAGAVVIAERADVIDDVLDVLLVDLAVEQDLLAAAAEARLGSAAEVHDHLDELATQRGSARMRSPISGGSASSRASRSSVGGLDGLRTSADRPPSLSAWWLLGRVSSDGRHATRAGSTTRRPPP